MHVRTLAGVVLGVAWLAGAHGLAFGQSLNARRTAMGGVLLPGGGPGSDGANVAYHAVAPAPRSSMGLPLPIGIAQILAHPPVTDPHDPRFNAYELANLVYNPPWNLQLVKPPVPSTDVVVTLGRDRLGVQLGELSSLFPEDHTEFGAVTRLPALGLGFRRFFAGVSAIGQFENSLTMNEPLHRALTGGEAFTSRTRYEAWDDAQAQAAGVLQLGWAAPVVAGEAAKGQRASGLYLGARARAMRGVAYADANNDVSFVTPDTLFANSPVEVDYLAHIRTAGPGGGGWGEAFDVGAVWLGGGFELGAGVNDLGSRLAWRVEESVAARDSATGQIHRTVTGTDVPFTSHIPATLALNAAKRFGSLTLAADAERGWNDRFSYHLGAEQWLGMIALRAGGSFDANRRTQVAGGVGLKLWRLGVDAAVATNSRNLSHERDVELELALAFYRKTETE